MCGRVPLLGVDEAGEEDWVSGNNPHLHPCILRLHTFSKTFSCIVGSSGSIHLSIHPSVRLSIRPPLRQSVRPSVRASVPPSVRPFARPSIYPFHQSVHLSVPPSMHLFVHASIRPCIHPSSPPIHPSMHQSILPWIHIINTFINLRIRSFIIHPSIYTRESAEVGRSWWKRWACYSPPDPSFPHQCRTSWQSLAGP